jgi:hypothetical protein
MNAEIILVICGLFNDAVCGMLKVGDDSYCMRFHACKLLPELRYFTSAIIIWSRI